MYVMYVTWCMYICVYVMYACMYGVYGVYVYASCVYFVSVTYDMLFFYVLYICSARISCTSMSVMYVRHVRVLRMYVRFIFNGGYVPMLCVSVCANVYIYVILC